MATSRPGCVVNSAVDSKVSQTRYLVRGVVIASALSVLCVCNSVHVITQHVTADEATSGEHDGCHCALETRKVSVRDHKVTLFTASLSVADLTRSGRTNALP